MPASRPPTIEKREIGAANSRSVNPISRSTASAIPPVLPASRHDWSIAPASMNERKLSTSGKPGRSTAPAAPPVWTASSRVGKTRIGATSCGRRNVCLTERAPSASTTRALSARAPATAYASAGSAASSPSRCSPGLGDEHVVERRLDQVERLHQDPGVVERAHDLGHVARAALELDEQTALLLGQDPPEVAADRLRLVGRAVGQPDLEVCLADLGLQRRRACPPRRSARPR